MKRDATITLATVYLPILGQIPYLKSILEKLDSFAIGILVTGGDLNFVLESADDFSSACDHLSYTARRRIKRALHSHQLVNVWCISYPTTKDYSPGA